MNTRKQIDFMVALVLLTVLAFGLYFVWEPTRASDAEDRQLVEAAERGAKLFAQNCRVCHGREGRAALENPTFPGLPLNLEANRPTEPSELKALQDKFAETIRCGRVGTLMPSWALDQGGSLNDEQIRQLVALITTNAGNAWEKEIEESEHLDEQFELPPPPFPGDPAEVNKGACGQIARPAPPAVSGEAARGWQLVLRFGCLSCHSTTGEIIVGPSWKGLFGSEVTLTDGTIAIVDEEYIRESLVDPTAKIVQDFEPLMPSFQGILSEDDINAIAEFIKAAE